MNTLHHHTSKATAFFSTLALLAGLSATPALHAAEYYWNSTSADHTWNQPSRWNSSADGSGVSPSAFEDGDIFHTNGKAVRTDAGASTFANGAAVTFVLDGGPADQLNVRAIGNDNYATLLALTSRGGTIVAANQDTQTHRLRVNTFFAESGTTFLSASSGSNRTLHVSIGTLTGSGGFAVSSSSGSSTVNFGADNATGFTGTIDVGQGTIHFVSDVTSGGSLVIGDGAKLSATNRTLSFTSVTIGGTALDAGTYSLFSLRNNPDFSDYFASNAEGSITVTSALIPEPAAAATITGLVILGLAALRRRKA